MATDADAASQDAAKLFKEGFYSEAICAYDAALNLADAPTQIISILCNRSAALLKAGKFGEAAEDAARAVALEPNQLKPRYRQACALYELGRHRDSLVACDAGLSLAPSNAQLLALRSKCEQELATNEVASAMATGAADISDVVDGGGAAAAGPSQDEPPPEEDGEYAIWCQAAANKLYGQGEYGQACAWYTHAITALSRVDGTAAEDVKRLATILSNRAACMLKLNRWREAANDATQSVDLDSSQVKAYARGSAALMRLGDTSASVEMAEAAVAASAPSEAELAAARTELLGLPARELREQLRDLRRAAARRAEEVERAERGNGGKRGTRRHGGRAPCLRDEEQQVSSIGDDSAAAPLEKEEMVSEVLRLKEAAARESSEGSAYQLATAAHAEAVAMRSRVVEIDELARRSEWHATLEHSTWLCAEYPQHATLRALRVDALLALKRYEEADRVLDEQLLATPDAPELLHARAMLVYIRQGGEAARTWLSEEVPDLEEDPIHAKSYDLHSCIGCMLSLSEKARKALTMADDVNASILACEALSVAEESPAARHSLWLLLARSLAKGARHVEAIKACDQGLAAASEARAALRGSGETAASTSSSIPTDQERLLLRRASSFLTLGQWAEAVADYRSAAALNPQSAQAASGLMEAWRALQAHQKVDSLYAVLGVSPDATADELKKAYRREALKWHPDKHAHEDAPKQIEAEERFRELAAAWAILSDEATRAAYDDDVQRRGG